jgi:hypothetical protein
MNQSPSSLAQNSSKVCHDVSSKQDKELSQAHTISILIFGHPNKSPRESYSVVYTL